ncbi:protocatechuate 3,4-dioxygenase subunit alpha, partial [Arthrobacter deserti]|nr:protocatechuate 3,4-dioxygenase subunit alpha [Arthrobacter deserti]
MTEPATKLAATPGQTIGPFYGYALPYEKGGQLVHRA